MIADIQEFTASVDPLWQWLAVMGAGAIPFVESYGAGPIGIVVGVTPIVAILAAIVGNIASMTIVVLATSGARDKLTNAEKPLSPRRQRFTRAFDKWGVPGVSLLSVSGFCRARSRRQSWWESARRSRRSSSGRSSRSSCGASRSERSPGPPSPRSAVECVNNSGLTVRHDATPASTGAFARASPELLTSGAGGARALVLSC